MLQIYLTMRVWLVLDKWLTKSTPQKTPSMSVQHTSSSFDSEWRFLGDSLQKIRPQPQQINIEPENHSSVGRCFFLFHPEVFSGSILYKSSRVHLLTVADIWAFFGRFFFAKVTICNKSTKITKSYPQLREDSVGHRIGSMPQNNFWKVEIRPLRL